MKNILITLFASVFMAISVIAGLYLWPTIISFSGLLLQLVVIITLACLIFVIVLKLLRCQALDEIIVGLRRKK